MWLRDCSYASDSLADPALLSLPGGAQWVRYFVRALAGGAASGYVALCPFVVLAAASSAARGSVAFQLLVGVAMAKSAAGGPGDIRLDLEFRPHDGHQNFFGKGGVGEAKQDSS